MGFNLGQYFPRAIKVFLVDRHPALRAGVRSCFVDESILVVGEASDGDEALRKVKRLSPHVIILENNLPSIDGGELARRLRLVAAKAKIVAFSAQSSQEHVVRMARCGAHGYVSKDAPAARLVEAVHHVHSGGLNFPPEMVDAILAPEREEANKARLTAREREVLVLLTDGLANKEIAQRLGISARTVETHREHLARKLCITTVAGLTKYAIQEGLTSLR